MSLQRNEARDVGYGIEIPEVTAFALKCDRSAISSNDTHLSVIHFGDRDEVYSLLKCDKLDALLSFPIAIQGCPSGRLGREAG